MAQIDFQIPEGDAVRDYDPIPAGEYVVAVESTARCAIKKGTGDKLEIVLRITDGEFVNRVLWLQFNMWHDSPSTAEGARRDWFSFATACGLVAERLKDTDQVVGKQCVVRVVSTVLDNGKSYPKVVGWKPCPAKSSSSDIPF